MAEQVDSTSHAPSIQVAYCLCVRGPFDGLQGIIERRLGKGRHSIGFLPRRNEALNEIADQPIYTAFVPIADQRLCRVWHDPRSLLVALQR